MNDVVKSTTNIMNETDSAPHEVNTFRRVLPQFLASSAKNLLIVDLGLILAFPSIVVPALIGQSVNLNPNETLHMTPTEASWLASVSFIGQPVGSVLSGLLTEPIGRKRAMLLVNIPLIIAWLMLAYAKSLDVTYTGIGLLGFAAGLMEAPLMTYISEICEPSVRGMLMAFAGISATCGIFMVYLLGSWMAWRKVAFICSFVPISTLIAICFVPETPIWLLSKHRTEDALKSLQWLRGWVSPNAVASEFNELKRHSELSRACISCEKLAVKCLHPAPTFCDKLKDMTRKRSLKPFFLITILFFVMQFSSMFAMRPYIVQILNAYGIPLDANLTTVILGVLGIVANVALVGMLRAFGKRKIYLYSMVGTIICCFGLGIYGYMYFPRGWTSFATNSNVTTTNSEYIQGIVGRTNYFAMTMFLVMHFCISIGVSSVPYFLMSEIFPFKSRTFSSGIVAAENCVLAFVATKTYYDLEVWLSLPGVICFYGIVGVIGFILMYFMMPETEQRSLEDIEMHFSDNSRSITDINITINAWKEHNMESNGIRQRY